MIAFVSERTTVHRFAPNPTTFLRKSAAVAVAEDGSWSIKPGSTELIMARDAVRDALLSAHRNPRRSSSADLAVMVRAAETKRAAHAAELAALRRVILHAYPPQAPRAVVLVDVDLHTLTTLIDDQLQGLDALLQTYDMLCGVDIRAQLRILAIDPGTRRLGELGAPHKTISLGRRSEKLTTAMFVQGLSRDRASLRPRSSRFECSRDPRDGR